MALRNVKEKKKKDKYTALNRLMGLIGPNTHDIGATSILNLFNLVIFENP